MASNRSLELFKKAAQEIPAYRQFIKANGLDPKEVKTVEDFTKVPLTSKKTYLQTNKLRDLMWDSDQQGTILYCSTSGSTGEPYYFPRNDILAQQHAHLVEEFLENSSYGAGKTLVLIGFGMGVWIGGVIAMRAFEIAAQRLNRPVAILPTGYNKTEILKALKRLAPEYEQTVIAGYPPFIKELVDDAPGEGIDLSRLHVRLFFAAETFTETFRDYVCEVAGIKDSLRDTLNVYGSADIGAMAYETPLSILIRRLIMNTDPLLRKELFRQLEKTPTLAQYNADFIEFEEVDGEVVLTGNAALPLVRYAIGDHGGTFDYAYIEQVLRRFGIDLESEIAKTKIGPTIDKHKPFVFVYERKDLAATLQGIIIYPEFIRETLLSPALRGYFTERFSMSTKHDLRQDQFLQVNLELHKGVKQSSELKGLALESAHRGLVARSSEYSEVSKTQSARRLLQIVLWPNGHPRYFAPGTKQIWVERS